MPSGPVRPQPEQSDLRQRYPQLEHRERRQPAFARWTRPLPATELLARQILTQPFHQHLTEGDVHRTVQALSRALAAGGTR